MIARPASLNYIAGRDRLRADHACHPIWMPSEYRSIKGNVILSGMLRILAAMCVLLGGAGLAFAQSGRSCTSGNFAGVLTHHNNNNRTGANLDEKCLTPDTVSSA